MKLRSEPPVGVMEGKGFYNEYAAITAFGGAASFPRRFSKFGYNRPIVRYQRLTPHPLNEPETMPYPETRRLVFLETSKPDKGAPNDVRITPCLRGLG
jgi:hypothetical protein